MGKTSTVSAAQRLLAEHYLECQGKDFLRREILIKHLPNLSSGLSFEFISFIILHQGFFKNLRMLEKLLLNYVSEELIKIVGIHVANKPFRGIQLPE